MADSPDAILLKRRARRRLVGAIALVVLIVVILPVILDQQPRTVTQPLTVRIPSQEGGPPFSTPVLPRQPSPPPTSKKGAAPQEAEKRPVDPASATAPKARVSEKKGARDRSRRERTEETDARRAKALLEDDAYVVPLGAFTQPDNARQVREKAGSAGVKSYTEIVKVPQGEHTRVRAGPFASRDAAEKARQKLKSLGIEVGQVVQK